MVDPTSCTLNYSSFFGGDDDDWLSTLGIDDMGNIIGAGDTFSNDIPIKNALETEKIGPVGDIDGFIFKLGLNETMTTTTSTIPTTMSTTTPTIHTPTTSTSSMPTPGEQDILPIIVVSISIGVIFLVAVIVLFRKS